MRQPAALADAVSAASPMMRDRLTNQSMEAAQSIDQTLTRPNLYTKTKAFTDRHAYFLQHGLQNVVDLVVWTGANSQALEAGYEEREAAKQADAAVRQTQGSLNAEDVSRIETGPSVVRLFSQFVSYFNMQGNLLLTEGGQAVRDGKPARLAWIFFMGFSIPALMAEAISTGLRGGLEDEDDDGYMDDMLNWFFGAHIRGSLALVPFVGGALNAAVSGLNDKPYDDKLSVSPALSAVEAGTRVPGELVSMAQGEGDASRTVKDVLTLLGLATGIPVGALGRPLGYAADVAEGDVTPTGPLDAARGAITGAPSPQSRD
jgi:hypothetical protein